MPRTSPHPRRRSTDFNGIVDIPQRVSRLETSVETIHAELSEVKAEVTDGFRGISAALQSSGKTNWQTVSALIVAAIAMWAAAIAPIHSELDRHDRDMKERHAEDIAQAQQLILLREKDAILEERLSNTRAELDQLRGIDKRIAILEAQQ